MSDRERADIGYWLQTTYHVPWRIIRSRYFWHDNVGVWFYRLIGCRFFGHWCVINNDLYDSGREDFWYCMGCESYVPFLRRRPKLGVLIRFPRIMYGIYQVTHSWKLAWSSAIAAFKQSRWTSKGQQEEVA